MNGQHPAAEAMMKAYRQAIENCDNPVIKEELQKELEKWERRWTDMECNMNYEPYEPEGVDE